LAGSCVIRVHQATMDTHPLYQLGCDPFRVDQGFIRGHIEMQIPFMDPAESPQAGVCSLMAPLETCSRRCPKMVLPSGEATDCFDRYDVS
jgi:hypothetical protein